MSEPDDLIHISGLSHTFGDPDQAAAVVALHEVSLTVPTGQYAVVVGPSGCGKTTLLMILGLMLQPTRGQVRLAGHDLAHLGEGARTALRRALIGFVFQRFNLLATLSALENVTVPLGLAGRLDHAGHQRCRDLLAAVGLDDKRHRRPGQLSLGEQQRVAIARALVNQPRLLLADEPTGSLDSRAGGAVLDLLGELHRRLGLTVVMITHSPAAAATAQRVITMHDGRIQGQVEPTDNSLPQGLPNTQGPTVLKSS